MGVLKRLWIPLLILVVLVAGGFTVMRLHRVFGSEGRPVYADTEAAERDPASGGAGHGPVCRAQRRVESVHRLNLAAPGCRRGRTAHRSPIGSGVCRVR